MRLSLRALLSLASLAASTATATAQLVATGASFKLDGVDYYVSPYPAGQAHDGTPDASPLPKAKAKAFGFAPVTVVADEVASKDSLRSLFAEWAESDDVWQPAFLSTIFLADRGCGPCFAERASYHEGVSSLAVPLGANDTAPVPSGPYFLDTSSGALHPAYRLYPDFAGAFSESLLHAPGDAFQPLSAHVASASALTIGVPSRLYYAPSDSKPLAGVRVGVKEIYDLAGVRKSNGNRAWWNLYPEAAATAPCIQNLVDAGAVVVGYQKTSQFANGESPTADWVDFHAPFNPRGDGYNNPSSSSSGAGASIAAYPWLDIAVGSDTGGSVRGPAGAQGIFGNRPSTGLVTLDGVMPLSPTLDTPGFLVRDPELWDAASAAMYGGNYTSLASKDSVEYPGTIYTVDLDGDDSPAGRLMTEFADSLAAFIGVDLIPFNLSSAWEETAPDEVAGVDFQELLGMAYPVLIAKEQLELVREPFYADYAAENDGRLPFVNPVPDSRWSWGDSIPDSYYEDAQRNKTLFMDWFNEQVLAPVSGDPCSSAILLYPGSAGSPTPRNVYTGSVPGVPLGFSNSRVSVFSEAPDSAFPLGEVATNSSITGQDEFLPVSISVMVAKGCDGVLTKLSIDLVDEGVLPVPKTGRTMDGADVLLKRELLGETSF